MTKEDLVNILSDVLSLEGFKQKGNNWVEIRGEVSKIVDLQKSQFGNSYYINYGYVINNLPLDGAKMHIQLRVSNADLETRDTVGELLMLDNQISDEDRMLQLIEVLNGKLIPDLRSINVESDIKQKVVDGTWLNILPISVRDYFDKS